MVHLLYQSQATSLSLLEAVVFLVWNGATTEHQISFLLPGSLMDRRNL